ncbi:MAG: HAD-IB family phosphatase [bacterium]
MKKLIFIDLDGTLTDESTWLTLNTALGITKEEDELLFIQYLQNDIAYDDWIKKLVEIHTSRGSITKTELKLMVENIPLKEGVLEMVLDLHSKGFHTVLLSGSVDFIVEQIAQKIGIRAWMACSKLIFNENETLIDIISGGDEIYKKETLAEKYIQDNDFMNAEIYALGDGANDIELFKKYKGILIGNNKHLEPITWKSIQTLQEIKDLI